MHKDAVAALHGAWPWLAIDGLCSPGKEELTPRGALVREAERFEAEIEICRKWLQECTVTKTVRTSHDTYRYKHEVEAWAGVWIPHFAMLVAAQLEGLPLEANPVRQWAALLPLGKVRPGALP